MIDYFFIGAFPLTSNLLLAPLAGYTNLPFRLCMHEVGGFGLASTELVHARSLLEQQRKALELIETCPADSPLAVQLFGSVAEEIRDAAQWLEEAGVAVIDLNMGCPVEKVVQRGAGAAMLCDPEKTGRLVRMVTSAVRIPVTVKTRLGWDNSRLDAVHLAPILEDAGVAALTIHGRTREGAFAGSVNRAGIRAVVQSVRTLPVFGNGDVCNPQSAKRMLDETGCAGLVIGRGALANPWVFHEIRAALAGCPPPPAPTLEERVAFMTRHFLRAVALRGETIACIQFRKMIDWYARAFGHCTALRLGMKQLSSAAQYHDLVGRFVEERRGADSIAAPAAAAC
ncbi:MAG TPA: tRNA dihydrouridine synthase DusB [Candidatus Binatia bacterium]|jgi:nifR3 family TIM-barrel protein|nr:tRNA dihydrouridine synthase DusB [Candidatus Binatia bacterium]